MREKWRFLLILLSFSDCRCDYLYQPIQTTSSLPEIIINKNAPPTLTTRPLPNAGSLTPSSGYFYPVPQPPNDILPPLQDEAPSAPGDHGYLPPPPQKDYLPPFQADFQPFQFAPHPIYGAPPSYKQKANVNEPLVHVLSMSCLDSADGRFFRALIQSPDFANTSPIFSKATFGCNIAKKGNDAFVLHLEGAAVGNCGARYCAGKKMCLNLRLPTVQGLQLPEDRTISLQCSPQQSIASVVKSIGIKAQKIHPRVIGVNTIAAGGSQRPFRPHLALYRKGNQLIEPGSAVLLGEELLLKATISENEEWKFVKVGSIVMQQGIQTGINGERKSVTLVDSDGCRVESMKSVCPNHPEQVSSKITVVPLRAFLFQDMDGDEMLLSVRVFGCMHQKDCQRAKHCEEKAVIGAASTPHTLNTLDGGRNFSLGRRKRSHSNHARDSHRHSANDSNATGRLTYAGQDGFLNSTIDDIQDYESHLDFRVILPPPNNAKQTGQTEPRNQSKWKDGVERINDYDYAELSMDDIVNNLHLIISVVLIIGISCIMALVALIKFIKKPIKTSNVRDC